MLPTLEERATLEEVVEGIRATGRDVMIVDDDSKDGTAELADEMAGRDPHVVVLHRLNRRGLGDAVMAGFEEGLALGYRLIFEMDAAGSHQPEDLDRLSQAVRSGGGMALGSRLVSGGSAKHRRWYRRWLTWASNAGCRAALGSRPKDWTTGYRCYSAEVLARIGPRQVRSRRYGFQVELVFLCLALGYPVTEVPIRFRDRLAGRSKLSPADIADALQTIARLARTRRGGSSGRDSEA